MEPAASPYIGAMRDLVAILVEPERGSEEWLRRRTAAIEAVYRQSRPPVPDDYRPEEVDAHDERQLEATAERARTAAIQAAEKIRSNKGDPRLESAFLEAAGHLVMDGKPYDRLKKAAEALERKWPLVGDVEDPSLRKTLDEAQQFCKVKNYVIHGDDIIATFDVALGRLALRARHQNEPQVLAFEPVGDRFLITSRAIFERDRPYELGPEHVLFITT